MTNSVVTLNIFQLTFVLDHLSTTAARNLGQHASTSLVGWLAQESLLTVLKGEKTHSSMLLRSSVKKRLQLPRFIRI